MLLLKDLHGHTKCLSFSPSREGGLVGVDELKARIFDTCGVPPLLQRVLVSGRQLTPDFSFNPSCGDDVFAELHLQVVGGKGGFGSLLKSQKGKGKKTTNFGAMRDLSGRRMRHVQQEKDLKNWRPPTKERRKELLEDYKILKKTGHLPERRPCHFGADCKYKYKCKFMHADDSEEVQEERKERNQQFELTHLASGFGDDSVYKRDDHEKRSKRMLASLRYAQKNKTKKARKNGDGESKEPPKKSEHQPMPGDVDFEVRVEPSASSSSSSSSASSSPRNSSKKRPHADVGSDEESPAAGSSSEEETTSSSSSSSSSPTSDSSSSPSAVSADESKQASPPKTKLLPRIPLERIRSMSSATELEAFGLEHLKIELMAYGMKCGGSLTDRAGRLYKLHDCEVDELPRDCFPKLNKKKKRKLNNVAAAGPVNRLDMYRSLLKSVGKK